MSSPFLLQVLILIPVVFGKNFAIFETPLDTTYFRFYGKFSLRQGCSSSPNAGVLPTLGWGAKFGSDDFELKGHLLSMVA